MKNLIYPAIGAIVLGVGAYVYLRPAPQTDTHAIATAAEPLAGAPIVEVALPADLSASAKLGKRGFDAVCAACHGENGSGRQGMGPPLVHKIYEPSHHGDMAFLMAVQRGVRAHHWPFGNMPPQQGLTEGDVKAITAYVRELQQANGIN